MKTAILILGLGLVTLLRLLRSKDRIQEERTEVRRGNPPSGASSDDE